MVAAKLQSYIVQICSLPLVRILQTLAIACAGFLTQVSQWSKEIGDSARLSYFFTLDLREAFKNVLAEFVR